jgi:hypothetical protein
MCGMVLRLPGLSVNGSLRHRKPPTPVPRYLSRRSRLTRRPRLCRSRWSCKGDAIALLNEVGKLMQDGLVQLLNTAFTTGSGTGNPTGIITALTGGSSVVNTGTNDTLAASDIYNVQSSLHLVAAADRAGCRPGGMIGQHRGHDGRVLGGDPAADQLIGGRPPLPQRRRLPTKRRRCRRPGAGVLVRRRR